MNMIQPHGIIPLAGKNKANPPHSKQNKKLERGKEAETGNYKDTLQRGHCGRIKGQIFMNVLRFPLKLILGT